ncbi:hypothetical protein CKM354_000769500 [Cercospora kikuchii]|uniref:Uncharacterized protein n=1 Tax=Cercospora kikuchii TaxID=84275 RepID=A0A9P3CKM4_9PEZI|nr:uncharacterized protein CKM354_000769500 [Cercospora kikuchii]GIZ44498.1 hypothetical protein CKM354_000769500 [Cercospora kikuchii]
MAPRTRSTAMRLVEDEEEEEEIPYSSDNEIDPETGDPLPFTSAHKRKVERENNFPPGALTEAYRWTFKHQLPNVIEYLRLELELGEIKKAERKAAMRKIKEEKKKAAREQNKEYVITVGDRAEAMRRSAIRKKDTSSLSHGKVPAPVQRGGVKENAPVKVPQATVTSGDEAEDVELADEIVEEEEEDDDGNEETADEDDDFEEFAPEPVDYDTDEDEEEDDDEIEEIPAPAPHPRFDYAVPAASVYGNPTSLGTWNHPSSLRPAYQPGVPGPAYRSGFLQTNAGGGSTLPTPLSARSPLFGDVPRADTTTLGRGLGAVSPAVSNNGGLFGSRPVASGYPSSFNGGGGNGLFANAPSSTGASIGSYSRPTAARSYAEEYGDLDEATIRAIREARRARAGNYYGGSRARFTLPCFSKGKKQTAVEPRAEPGKVDELKRRDAMRKNSVDRPHLKGSITEPSVKRSNAQRMNSQNRPHPAEVRFRNPDGVRRKPAVRYKDGERPRYYVN